MYTRNWLRILLHLIEKERVILFEAHPMSGYEVPFSRDILILIYIIYISIYIGIVCAYVDILCISGWICFTRNWLRIL